MSFAEPSPGHQATVPAGGGTQTCAVLGRIRRSTPTNVANVSGLMNSSVITSPGWTARLVNAVAPPDPLDKLNGAAEVKASVPETVPPVKTRSLTRIRQSVLRIVWSPPT